MLILLPILLPIIMGAMLLVTSFVEHLKKNNDYQAESNQELKRIHIFSITVLVISAVLAIYVGLQEDLSCTLFYLLKDLPIYFAVDSLSLLFVSFISIVFVLVGIYSCVYMKHEHEEKRFFGFYLIVYGVLVGLDFAGNLVTLYLFYEFMTLTSMPFVLHNGTHESKMASLKYLFYSMCGAYLGLFGIFVLYQYAPSLTFTAGGVMNGFDGNITMILVAVMCMLIGFGAKAGMFPLHAWLPSAHPVAPSPASAVLSSIIVKCGVLAIIRVVFYIAGPALIAHTWVQYAWMILSLLTVFMGSLLAFREPIFKKRLAYSSVSQVSYVLFGLAVLTTTGFEGALLHTVFHAFIKCALFLTAGIFIFKCHITRVSELQGIGKAMPITLWCFTFASLGLIGIPPTSGFISKWYLALGALQSDIGVLRYVGPAILLVSALLTAGYLLEIVVNGFFPKEGSEIKTYGKEPKAMWIPLMILAGLTLCLGILPNGLIEYISTIANSLF